MRADHSPPAPLNKQISSPGCKRKTWTWRAAAGASATQVWVIKGSG
jgi:hypothetical protein